MDKKNIYNDFVQKLKQYLDENFERYMKIYKSMVDINSFTENREGIEKLSSYTADVFSRLGFSAEKIASVNPRYGSHLVLNKTGIKNFKIGCVSHLDTVFPPEEEIKNRFSWRIEDDKVYGPGTCDIKGGTLLIYMMMDALKNIAPDLFEIPSWEILLDASEETESDDFGALCVSRLAENGAACLIFEASEAEDGSSVVAARKGRATFTVSAEGKGAHAGTSHAEGANAIVALAGALTKIASFTDYSKDLTFNPGTISGGTVVNRVPHFAESAVEMRAFRPDVIDEGIAKISSLNGPSEVKSSSGFAAQISAKMMRRNPSWPRNRMSDSLVKIWEESAEFLGKKFVVEERGGLSDGNFTWGSVPTIDGLGPRGNNAHCSENDPGKGKEQEYAVVSSFVPKTILNALSVIKLIESFN